MRTQYPLPVIVDTRVAADARADLGIRSWDLPTWYCRIQHIVRRQMSVILVFWFFVAPARGAGPIREESDLFTEGEQVVSCFASL